MSTPDARFECAECGRLYGSYLTLPGGTQGVCETHGTFWIPELEAIE